MTTNRSVYLFLGTNHSTIPRDKDWLYKMRGSICFINKTELTETRDAVKALLGEEPGSRRGFALAGPNDWIQLLFEHEIWLGFAGYFLAKAGDKAVDYLADKAIGRLEGNSIVSLDDASVARIIAALKAEEAREQSVSLGYVTPTPDDTDRNFTIALDHVSPEKFAEACIYLAAIGDDVELHMERSKSAGAIWTGVYIEGDVLKSQAIQGGKISFEEAKERVNHLLSSKKK